MALRRLNSRHQITIPPGLLREAGAPEGGLYSIRAEPGRIILEPKELQDKEFEETDWRALDRLVKRQLKDRRFTEYPSPEAAKVHFKRLGL